MADELTKESVIGLLTQALGDPAKVLKKIVGWRVGTNIDLVVQLDSRQSTEHVYVWVPVNERGVTPIDCPCDLYAAGKSRHHNVAGFASLDTRRWALRFRPRTNRDIVPIVRAMVTRGSERARPG